MKTYRELNLKLIRDECDLDFAHHTFNKGQCSCCYSPLDIGRGWKKGRRPKRIDLSDRTFKWDCDLDSLSFILFKNAYNCGHRIKSLDEYVEDMSCLQYQFTSDEQKLKVCNMLQDRLGDEYKVIIPKDDTECIVIRLVDKI